jgi:ATP-dependent Clp protease ATP-binding subunit ClpA
MLERFSSNARSAVVAAQETARDRGAANVRTEHLLLALFGVPDSIAVQVLAGFAVTKADVEADIDRIRGAGPGPSDAEALATLGIDLDEVRRQVEEAFGPGALDRTRAAIGREGRGSGHVRFDAAAKKTLELALREALALKHSYIGSEHLLLGMLHTETGAAHHILAGRGMDLPSTREAVAALVDRRQAG